MLVGRSKTLLTTYQPACFEKFLRPYSEFLHPCENLNCEIEGLDSVIGGGGIQLLSVACFSQKKKKKTGCCRHNINCVGLLSRKILSFCQHVKDKLEQKSPDVYSVPCECQVKEHHHTSAFDGWTSQW